MGQRSDQMTRRRHTPEQIVRKLREADRLLGEGMELPEVTKQLEVSEATYHRWRTQYGGMKADDVKRLKELETENARLKRIVADQTLHIAALNEVSKGIGEPVATAPGGPDAPGPPRHLGTAGVPVCRTAPLDPAP
jgi:putative transposase